MMLLAKWNPNETILHGLKGTGFVTGDVIEYVPKVTPVKNFATSGLDFRDFLFAVVDQLSYRALKDLRKRKKLLAQHGGGAGTSLAVELRNLEERARREREENMQVRSQARPVRYGDVVQLQHLRTGMYVGVKAKFAAEQQATSRRVELQDGTMASWLTVTPFFSHRKQGELVTFNEMVSLESPPCSPFRALVRSLLCLCGKHRRSGGGVGDEQPRLATRLRPMRHHHWQQAYVQVVLLRARLSRDGTWHRRGLRLYHSDIGCNASSL
eukprot:symbB.v1.2.017356.t1/scaffold1352.1/size234417/5